MSKIENLEIKVIDEIGRENISDLTQDYAEIGLDFFIDNEALKDIPVFGTFYKIYKTANNIKDQIFLKKLYAFLFHLKQIPQDKRIKFINTLDYSEKTKQETGQKLLLLIDKLDDFDKPKILSNLLKATIEEKIDYKQFLKLSNVVCNAYIGDLNEFHNNQVLSMDLKERLYNLGIFSLILKNIDSRGFPIQSRSWNFQGNENKKQINIDLDSTKIDSRNKANFNLAIDFEINSIGKALLNYGLKNGS
ncbi:MAG: hypothetical protein IPL31_00095 [Saprospiraceae bacterium]|nr:hypothetical protein [Saprospiraceae bacterium]